MASLAELESEKEQYQEQLDLVLGQLRDDPDNVELKTLEEELKNFVHLLNENIAELKPKQAPKSTPNLPEPPKWSRENHPAFKKSAPPPQDDKEDTVFTYHVNDTVLAKWLSGDKGFYPAKITSITGSSAAPVYVVKFKSYDNTETLRSRDIRPVSNKRKADVPPPPASSTLGPPQPGLVSSAGATTYSNPGKQPETEAKPPKPKKIKAKKELEAGKNKWQEFNAKSKYGKSQKKESMFRTPDGIRGRVGFTGSGQAMRKDPSRSRHVYQVNDELD